MLPLSYQQAGLVLKRSGTGASDSQIRDLQRHLRALGYLRRGIDGAFGGGTEGTVKGLQHDLLPVIGPTRWCRGPIPAPRVTSDAAPVPRLGRSESFECDVGENQRPLA